MPAVRSLSLTRPSFEGLPESKASTFSGGICDKRRRIRSATTTLTHRRAPSVLSHALLPARSLVPRRESSPGPGSSDSSSEIEIADGSSARGHPLRATTRAAVLRLYKPRPSTRSKPPCLGLLARAPSATRYGSNAQTITPDPARTAASSRRRACGSIVHRLCSVHRASCIALRPCVLRPSRRAPELASVPGR